MHILWEIVGGFVILMIAAIATVWAWIIYPRRKINAFMRQNPPPVVTPLELEELESEHRKSATQVVGSLLLILTILISFAQFQTSRDTSNRIQANEQFAKGFELLGKGKTERIGGIYALKSAMDAVPENRRPIIEGLVAFMRRDLFSIGAGRCEEMPGHPPETLSQDAQAALRVIADYAKGTIKELDLSRINLQGVDLKDVDFRGLKVVLAYSDLSGAKMRNVKFDDVNIYCTNFYDTDLTGAQLPKAHASGARFTNGHLDGINLQGAELVNALLDHTTLYDANLVEANLTGADLGLAGIQDADFKDATLINTSFDLVRGKPKNPAKIVVEPSGSRAAPTASGDFVPTPKCERTPAPNSQP